MTVHRIRMKLKCDLIQEYAKRARREWTEDFCDGDAVEGEALNMIRKITAIGLRCMEHHGAPERLVGPQQKPPVEYVPAWVKPL